MDENESLEIKGVTFLKTSTSGFNKGGPGTFQYAGINGSSNRIWIEQNGIIWEADTLNTDAEIIGPGTVYVGRTFNYNYQNWSDFSSLTTMTYNYDIQWRIRYQILGDSPEESKFSVSLDDDGDRVAVGYKESGSNAVVRVYEYSNGSWEQLGDDVE